MEPSNNPVPKHIAVIMDGNRRFARRLMMKPCKGHEWGAKKIEQIIEWCHELGVEELTLYTFSIQNFDRPKKEFDYLMGIVRNEAERLLGDERIDRYGIRVNFLGRLSLFPNDIQSVANRLMDKTKDHDRFVLNIAFGYGGREEVLEAVYRIGKEVQDGKIDPRHINEDVFEKHLYTASKPDLIIRTGGEHRTSNFLIWQSAYSELLFVEKMWPEFEKEDFVAAISDYKQRSRRFGK